MTTEKIMDFIRTMQRVGGECIVCGERTGCVDIFFPTNPVAYGLGEPPEGKWRAVPVYLCEKHPQDPYTREIVEQLIRMKARSRQVTFHE